MRGALFPTTIYLSDDQRRKIALLSLTTKRPKAEITRRLIAEGLKTYQAEASQSSQVLAEIADIAEQLDIAGPSDLSARLDDYLWHG